MLAAGALQWVVRLGEQLLATGAIDVATLEQALRAQVVLGGRIGTNLVEHGVPLDVIAAALAAQRELPAATIRDFDNADPTLRRRLSPRLAATLGVVPLSREADGRVRVAVMAPLAAEAMAELEIALGAEPILTIAPELRIYYQIERHFGVRRPSRMLRVAPHGQIVPPAPNPPPRERRQFLRTLSDEDTEPIARIKLAKIAVPAPAPARPRITTFNDAVVAIRKASGRDAMGDAVIAALEGGFDEAISAAMLLVCRRQVAVGWKGFVRDGDARVIETIAMPLSSPSMFQEPMYKGPFCGPPPGGGRMLDQRLWRALGLDPPRAIAVAPVTARGKTVCLLYAQSSAAGVLSGRGGHQVSELALELGAAFERLLENAT